MLYAIKLDNGKDEMFFGYEKGEKVLISELTTQVKLFTQRDRAEKLGKKFSKKLGLKYRVVTVKGKPAESDQFIVRYGDDYVKYKVEANEYYLETGSIGACLWDDKLKAESFAEVLKEKYGKDFEVVNLKNIKPEDG